MQINSQITVSATGMLTVTMQTVDMDSLGPEQKQVPDHQTHRLSLPVSDVASRQHLRSASQRLLVVPRHRLSTYGRRAFAVAGPTAWDSFLDYLRDPDVTMDNFKRLLKTFLFSAYQCN